MALWPLATVPNCLPYTEYTGWAPGFPGSFYQSQLITPPRHYAESIDRFTHFFYEPSNDALVAFAWLDVIWWPGWAVSWFKWSASDGSYLGRGSANFWNMTYASGVGMGSYNKFFGFWVADSHIYEFDWQGLYPNGGWGINPTTWRPPSTFGQVVVNLQDNLIAGVKDWSLDVWSINGAPYLRGSLRLPNTLGALTYESRENCWIITHDGLIAKANYRVNPPRWEMLSAVQNPSPDATNYFCAFDTRRNRLAVLRVRPDAVDGACQCQLEFYRPLYRVAGLTDPVPVSPLRAGQVTRFVAHLYGDAGEGVASHLVNAALAAPALGEVVIPVAGSELNGAVTLGYQGGAVGSDTLQLSATITDGEG